MEKGEISNKINLESWKEIAAYLDRSEKTCRRWEHELGLPIHRIEKSPKARVFAYKDELDQWVKEKYKKLDNGGVSFKKRRKRIKLYAIIAAFLIAIVAGYLMLNGILQKEMTGSIKKTENKWVNSIAILPIVDLSPNKDQEYFCDGMTEQIISNLTKLQKLKVSARTSIMKFRRTEKTIPQIGRELKVAYILEGSLRKFGDRIRVTVKLINVKDGFHLWSEDYNKKYKEIFDVWDDVSEKIGKALLQKLSIKETAVTRSKRPANLEAYNYYLRAEHIHGIRLIHYQNQKDFNTAEGLFKRAIELDPTYALAHAGLANLYDSFAARGKQKKAERKRYYILSEKYTERAFRLDPTSARVNFMRGVVWWRKGDLDKAWGFYKKALLINPNDAFINRQAGYFLFFRGLTHLAIILIDRAIELDPLYIESNRSKALYTAFYLGKFDQAEKDYRKILELSPKDRIALYQYSRLLLLMKKYDAAREMIEKHNKLYPDYEETRRLKAMQFAVNGEKEKALDIKLNFYNKGYIFLFLKMKEESIQYISKIFENKKKVKECYYLMYKNNPTFDFLRDDPRFQKILVEHKKLYEENLRKYGDLK